MSRSTDLTNSLEPASDNGKITLAHSATAGQIALGACPRIRRGRAHGACEARSRREEEAMSMHIVDDEQRRDRPQHPCALPVPGVRGHLRRCRSSAMYNDAYLRFALPGICPLTAGTRPLLILKRAPSVYVNVSAP